jgi:O-methyltransferase
MLRYIIDSLSNNNQFTVPRVIVGGRSISFKNREIIYCNNKPDRSEVYNLLQNIVNYDKPDRSEIFDLLKNIVHYDGPDRNQVFDLMRRVIYNNKDFKYKQLDSIHQYDAIYNDLERSKVLDLIYQIKREREFLMADNEAYQLFMLVKKTYRIDGDIAEVGVYEGGSSKIICEAKGNRSLHLFDTFDGLPNVSEIDKWTHNQDIQDMQNGLFRASMSLVVDYLKNYGNIYFYKGVFPLTADPIRDKYFSFVHLDVDTYDSTKSCLDFFYQRMRKGGIILSHDYLYAQGVRKAFDEYFDNKLETVIELPSSQCLVVKL